MKKTVLFLFLSLMVLCSLFAEGGDGFGDAINISVLPFNDTGDTSVGYTNTIGNTAADAFYLINSMIELTNVSIDLSGSAFDTYLRVYDSTQTQLWSDDDGGSGNTSLLSGLTLAAGTEYYICVEGYSGNVGAYTLNITADQSGDINNASAPGSISNISPVAEATEVALLPELTWDFGTNTETYDLFFDSVNPPVTQVVTDGEAGMSGSYTPASELTEYTTYYWKVVSKNSVARLETPSAVYSFTTVDLAPGNVSNASPANIEVDVALDAVLTWDFAGNTETYDLYFDTVNPPLAQVVTDGEAITGSYTPDPLTVNTVYYWKVVSKNTSSLRTAEDSFQFTTVLGANIVSVGAGTTVGQGIPIEPYYGYTYSQCIYLQSEIATADKRIEKIWYHYNWNTDLSASTQWVIYMGHTELTEFATTTSWIPVSELTQVGSFVLDPNPTPDGWIEFVLTSPFAYNNIDNLVIAVDENQSGYETGSDEFYCTTSSTYRALQYQNDSTNPDPAIPPTGTRKLAFANIRFQFGDLPEIPEFVINPESKDFGTVFTGSDSNPQVFTILNNGGANLVIADPIALETGTYFTLTDANSYPLTIAPAGTANFSITYNATVEGLVTDNVIIVDNTTRVEHSIPLSGTGFEATVSSFPFTQSFDTSTVPTGWTADPSSGAWTLSQTEFGGHGATSEHTGNSGYYIGIDDSSPETVPAHLYSPPFNFSGLTNPVLSFWYWIGDSANSSELHVDVITDLGTDASVDVLTNPSGTASNGWVQAIVSLSAYAGTTISLDFRGMESTSYTGDICLDDIYIFNNTNPPAITTLVSPADAAIDQATTGIFEWTAVPYADGYDLYFGTDNPPTSILEGADQGTNTSYSYSGLAAGTTYYWQVVPYNTNGDALDCSIWSFSTSSSVPDPSTVSLPLDGAISVNVYGNLVWNTSALADGYYIYFGTDTPPTNVENMTDMGTETSYTYGPIAYSTMYYWQVIPYNGSGVAEECPIWSFTSQSDPRLTTPYYQSFNGSTSIPTKWTTNMTIRALWGVNGTNALYKNLYSSVPTCYAELENMMGIGANDYFKMYYRIVNYTNAPNVGTVLGSGDEIAIKASTDGGATYSTIYTINSTTHITSNLFTHIEIPVGSFAGNDVKFRIEGQWANGDWDILIDNVYVGPIQSNIIISEVNTETPQYVEIYNAGNVEQSLAGWSLQQNAPSATTTITAGCVTNLPENFILGAKEYVSIISGTLVDFMEAYPSFTGYYIAEGSVPQLENGSWLILDNGLTKTTTDQFGSATSGAVLGTIYERLDADSNGDDVNNDWTPTLAPTPSQPNENDIQNDLVLPVELTSFAAITMTSQDEEMIVRLSWTVETESNILGYNLYRSYLEEINSSYRVNSDIVQASNETSSHEYNYDDSEVLFGDTFYYWLESVAIDGISQFFGPVAVTVDPEQEEPETPEVQKVTSLNSIYPNPFNPSTAVTFSLKEESKVTVRVFNVRGELVSELANGVFPSSLSHTVVWNGMDRRGNICGSGIYFIKMQANDYTAVKKAVLVK
jgi:hypothetical protein